MLIYYLLVGVPLVLSIIRRYGISIKISGSNLGKREKQAPKDSVIMVFFIFFFALLALRREDVGVDIKQYVRYFKYARNYSFGGYLGSFSNERGFYALTKIISIFTDNARWFLVVMAVITVFPLMHFYSRESEHPMLTIAFFLISPLFAMLFSGLRQSIAIAMVVPAYYLLKRRKLLWFILVVAFASLFHQSAWIFLLLYPVYYMKWSRKVLLVILPILVLIYLFNAKIYLALATLWGDEYSVYAEVSETGAFMLLLLFVLCSLFAYFILDEEKADAETLGLRNICIVSTALQVFSVSNPIASRMNYYFILFFPIMIPKVINRCSDKNKKWCTIIGWVMTAYFLFYFFRRAHTGADILQTYPYYAFWQ